MSWLGTMMGEPLAGCRMLLVDIISTRASSWASSERGTCTAIWSPSKSALKAAQTSGCSWMALPSIRIGSNAWMPRRCSVGARFKQDGVLADHLVEHVPDLALLLLDQLLGLLDGGRLAHGLQPRVDERLEQLQRHLLGQPALVQLELGADHDHRAARVVHALAEQVLAEPALLALQHVGQRLQRPLVGAGDDAAAPAVVEQGIDRLLQHPLLVADDDVGGAQLHQPLQAVVAVDDAAVEVVEVGRGEAAAVERHQGPQLGRDHRNHGQDHPLRPVAGLDEGLDHLEALGELLGLELGGRLGDLLAQLVADLAQVHARQQVADRLRADAGGEGVLAVLLDGLVVLLLGQQLLVVERRRAPLGDDVVLEVEHALEVLERHVEEQADAGRERLQEPDVRDGGRQLDVAHALAAHLGERHLDAALLADQALVLHALVLAAQALVVLDRPEDARAEQPVPLRLEGAVVDGLGLLDLAERPGGDVLRAGDGDADLVEGRDLHLLLKEIGDLVHRLSLSWRGGALCPPKSLVVSSGVGCNKATAALHRSSPLLSVQCAFGLLHPASASRGV